ncbi:MAG: protein TonB [Parasphingorhabdus sp.]|jgi:protein TonB
MIRYPQIIAAILIAVCIHYALAAVWLHSSASSHSGSHESAGINLTLGQVDDLPVGFADANIQSAPSISQKVDNQPVDEVLEESDIAEAKEERAEELLQPVAEKSTDLIQEQITEVIEEPVSSDAESRTEPVMETLPMPVRLPVEAVEELTAIEQAPLELEQINTTPVKQENTVAEVEVAETELVQDLSVQPISEALEDASQTPLIALSLQASATGAPTTAPGQFTDKVLAWLERHKRYPTKARRRQLEGVVMLFFSMGRNGQVLEYRIEQGSGHPILDQAVVNMINAAQPLPAIPEEYAMNQLDLLVPVQFSLRSL